MIKIVDCLKIKSLTLFCDKLLTKSHSLTLCYILCFTLINKVFHVVGKKGHFKLNKFSLSLYLNINSPISFKDQDTLIKNFFKMRKAWNHFVFIICCWNFDWVSFTNFTSLSFLKIGRKTEIIIKRSKKEVEHSKISWKKSCGSEKWYIKI